MTEGEFNSIGSLPPFPPETFKEVLTRADVYCRKKLYVGLGLSELRRLKQLNDKNRRPKLVAELSLTTLLQDVLSKKPRPDAAARGRPICSVAPCGQRAAQFCPECAHTH